MNPADLIALPSGRKAGETVDLAARNRLARAAMICGALSCMMLGAVAGIATASIALGVTTSLGIFGLSTAALVSIRVHILRALAAQVSR